MQEFMCAEISHNQEKKDKREWAIIQMFRSSCPTFPIGELRKSESPDFLLQTDQRLYGIELTELKYERQDKEFNLRAHEDFLSVLMRDAQVIFERKHNFKLIVDVHFSNELNETVSLMDDDLRSIIRQDFAETIVKIVEENLPEATGIQYKVDRSSKYGFHNLPQKIECINIKNVTGRWYDGLWYAAISTKVKPLSVASVSQRLVAKECKLKKYNPTCDEQWLIIIQNSFLMSSSYNPLTASEALAHTYKSTFDKVFVFERSAGSVSLLKTEKYD